jgi:hypothetical protein
MSVPTLTVLLPSVTLLLATVLIPPGSNPLTNSVASVAGDYYYGDGLGINCSLSIKPDGHFAFRWTGCLGVYDQNTGGATVVARHLILTPDRPNVREGFRGTATDFHVVPWGDRLYLVPEKDRQAFCNAINQGREPRFNLHGRFHVRRGDWEKKVAGLPDVPESWRPLLLSGSLRGKIVEVLSNGQARVDIGAKRGVWKGMELWVETGGFGLVEVVEVGEETCIIAAKYRDMDRIDLHKGQKASTRLAVED